MADACDEAEQLFCSAVHACHGRGLKGGLRLAGYTPLALAAQAGHANVVRHLLHQGADPNVHKPGAAGPLHCAAASGLRLTTLTSNCHGR